VTARDQVCVDQQCFGLRLNARSRALVLVIVITWVSVLTCAAIVAFLGLLGEGLSRILRRVGRRAGVKETTLITFRDVIRVIWIALAVVGVAFELNLTSDLTVLAVSTVGGLIVSLALQATLSNVIAGLFMLEDGTLRVGDEVTYSGIKGKIIRIALRTTWILTEKGVIVVVSNSNLMGGPLTIHTATSRLASRYSLRGIVSPASISSSDTEKSTQPEPNPAPGSGQKPGQEKLSDGRARKEPVETSDGGST
jgi:small-conductance mechanosensitive channel